MQNRKKLIEFTFSLCALIFSLKIKEYPFLLLQQNSYSPIYFLMTV